VPTVPSIALAQQELALHHFKTALKLARRAQKESPASPVPENIAGIALSALSRPLEAVKSFKRSIGLNAAYPEPRRNLAQTYLLMGEPAAALQALKPLPDTPEVLYIRAQALAALGRKEAALAAVTGYIESAPGEPRGYRLRAQMRLQFGLIPDALEDFRQVLALAPEDADTLTAMSLPLARHLRTEEALDSARRAVEIAAGHVAARLRLAAQYAEMGETERAVDGYREVLRRAPGEPEALKALAEILKGAELAALEPEVAQALSQAEKGSAGEALLLLARFQIRQSAGAREKADQDLLRANRFFARRSPYQAAAEARTAEKILRRFAEVIPAPATSNAPLTPIFVLGLPRSGTTLVEALLGRAEGVAPLGERGTLGFLLEETIENDLPLEADRAAALRAEDRRLLPALPAGTRAYVDKMPENFRLVGFLKTIYPEAKIVHLRRDPRDVALSMFQAHFSGAALNYTYDLKAMAAHFNLYARMMAHWRAVLPGQIHELRYEDLVADIAGEGRRLAAFCGLDWRPEMAEPHRTRAQILTMSANQLRRPVHGRSIGKWREREALLAPFLKGLEREHWPEVG
jgi:tetratricopeptide (TPR) repeat protein